MNIALNLKCNWQPLCSTADLVANSGVVALLEGQQVALFYLPESEQQVFAIGNCDPKSGANVIGRGIVGHLQGELVIASPLYKQHYDLNTGACLEQPELSVRAHAARVEDGQVLVRLAS